MENESEYGKALHNLELELECTAHLEIETETVAPLGKVARSGLLSKKPLEFGSTRARPFCGAPRRAALPRFAPYQGHSTLTLIALLCYNDLG